jgi:phosphatidylglycerophosphate synthase
MTACDAWAGLTLPLVCLLLLVIAAIQGPHQRHARVTREGGTAFLGEPLMHWGYTWIDRLARLALWFKLSPTSVSWLSLLLGLGAGLGMAKGHFGLAAWLLALSGLGDGMDGAMARLQGKATRRGAVLDSALDRYVEFFCLAGLIYFYRGVIEVQMVALVALFGSFMVTYSTAKAEALSVKPPRGWMKRPERLVWLIGGAALASALPLAGCSGRPVLVAVLALIAVIANLSAIIRLFALSRSV